VAASADPPAALLPSRVCCMTAMKPARFENSWASLRPTLRANV
jgi:hypothetical protein